MGKESTAYLLRCYIWLADAEACAVIGIKIL